MYNFSQLIFEDVTFEKENVWSSICKSCVGKYNLDKNLLDDAGTGCCMILNCENEADYYIDFPKNKVIETNK